MPFISDYHTINNDCTNLKWKSSINYNMVVAIIYNSNKMNIDKTKRVTIENAYGDPANEVELSEVPSIII